VLNDGMKGELERIWKEVAMSQHFHGETEEED
jgi:hypothetical protein